MYANYNHTRGLITGLKVQLYFGSDYPNPKPEALTPKGINPKPEPPRNPPALKPNVAGQVQFALDCKKLGLV